MSRSDDEQYNYVVKDVHRELQDAKSAGGHMVALGILAAFTIYAGMAAASFAALGPERFFNLDPIWFLVGAIVGAGPALACLLAGYMGRQNLRTARANAVILRASQLLLMPSEIADHRVKRLGQSVREEAYQMNALLDGAQASLSDLRGNLEKERHAVSLSTEENSAHIAKVMHKLADERQALAELTSSVDAQAEAMSDAIPRQARLMAEAARSAQADVTQADDVLKSRISSLEQTVAQLSETLTRLGQLGEDGEMRTTRLVSSIGQVEERLDESAHVIDTAIKASDLAASAAAETGNSLNAAVASALDGTREASEYIRQQSRDAVAEAMQAMAELRQTGEQAEASLSAVSTAARTQAQETEKHIDQMSTALYESASRATHAVEAGLDRARQRMEHATALLSGTIPDTPAAKPSAEPDEDFALPSPITGPRKAPETLRLRQTDPLDELEGQADTEKPKAIEQREGPAPPPSDGLPWDVQPEAETAPVGELDELESDLEKETGISWKDLLAGLDSPTEERDEAARHILTEITQSGVKLDDVFNAKMVKKISGAARRGDRNRYKAVREFAGADVQTLKFRLQDDISFKNSVDRFLTTEEPDALRALTETERSRASASKRLTAFLLLDTAMGSL